jgi:hypothetical protein
MNREILFRAWHKQKKIMCDVLLTCFVNRYVNVLPEYQLEGGNQEEWRFDEIELMQFTGLTDKHGRKIFEGDILRTMSGIAVVVWCDAAFALESPGSEAVDWEHSSVFEQSEILGNIHQTPELYRDGWRDFQHKS